MKTLYTNGKQLFGKKPKSLKRKHFIVIVPKFPLKLKTMAFDAENIEEVKRYMKKEYPKRGMVIFEVSKQQMNTINDGSWTNLYDTPARWMIKNLEISI